VLFVLRLVGGLGLLGIVLLNKAAFFKKEGLNEKVFLKRLFTAESNKQ
jgi:Trk-type K+ transport system membrane component